MKIFISVVLFLLLAFIAGHGLNPNLYKPSRLETNRIFLRDQYFGEGLGKIYKNRFGLFYFNKIYPQDVKFETVFFSTLNPVYIFLPLYGALLYLGYKKMR